MSLTQSLQTLSLGATNVTVPALGIGTWAWGDRLFWSYGKEYGETEVREAFEAALAEGVAFFDTAEVYGLGESERLLGRFMQATEQPVQIATKYFPLPWRLSADAVAEAVTHSLKRLQVSTIDLYQVHMPFDFFMSKRTLMQALAHEVEQGRIRAIGVSNYSAQQMREVHQYLAEYGIPLAVNQVQYSLLARKIESNGVMATARELGVTILAYSPLAQGLLTGKYAPGQAVTLSGARRLDPRFNEVGLRKIAPVLTLLQKLAVAHDRTPAQVALNWLIAQGNVIPIPGAKTANQACQNAGALGWSLTPEEVAELDVVSLPWK
jgi:aryl-alcohol dehydrogenase-like predicted oxidoreductase